MLSKDSKMDPKIDPKSLKSRPWATKSDLQKTSIFTLFQALRHLQDALKRPQNDIQKTINIQTSKMMPKLVKTGSKKGPKNGQS